MAKINNSTPRQKGSNKNPRGTMPADQIKRFKLSGNYNIEGRDSVRTTNPKGMAKKIRALSTYRMFVHGVAETKLPASIRQAQHYFNVPLTRADSDNPKDRRGIDAAATVEADTVETSV